MTFITAAAIIGGGTLLGGVLSASGARSAAAKAADANLAAARETNAQNLNLFNLSRGAPGSDGYGHSLLPTYFGGNEQAFGQSAYDNFQRLQGLGNQGYGAMVGNQDMLRPSLYGSFNAINNHFNGQDLAQRMGYANPYFNSRSNQANVYGQGLSNVAGANSSAIDTGLAQTLARLNANRAGQGFFGNSTFDRNRMLAATMGARQQAGVMNAQATASGNDAMAGAQLANAGDYRSMQLANLDYMGNPNVAAGAMQAANGFESGPANYLAQMYSQAQAPMNFFRMQPQAFEQQNLPMQSPQLNNSQIFGSALTSGIGAAGNAYFSGMFGAPSGTTAPNPYTSQSYAANTGLGQGYQFNPSSNFLNFNSGGSAYGSPAGFNYSMGAYNPNLYTPRG